MNSEYRKKQRKSPALWRLLLGQVLLTGLVLCIFALFHHVIPDWKVQQQGIGEPMGTVERKKPEPTPEPTPSQPAAEGTEEAPAPVPTVDPDSLAYRFAEHFASEPTWDENSYRSPSLSVTITEYANTEAYPRLTYYVADIYLADVECFRVGFPEDSTYDTGERIAEYNRAVLAINGDSMLTQHSGLLIRNGQIYNDTTNAGDLCVLYYDGSIETYSPGTYSSQEILKKEPFHSWQFGPMLLDESGQPLDEFNISRELQGAHPRTALGYYEPGHYCFVVVDGRKPEHSDGADMRTLAEIMSGLGCRQAYNLDGGASSMMIFNGNTVNQPAKTGAKGNERYINDMLILTEQEGGYENR